MENYKFKYENGELFKELMFLQIDKDGETYQKRSVDEFNNIKNLISGKTKKVIDLGCGLGRSSIFFKNMLSMDDTLFYMCDFTGKGFDKTGPCGEHTSGNIPYNDLTLTDSFTTLNNLTNTEIVDLNKGGVSEITNVDLLYSFHCVGYHWDISDSFKNNNLENVLSENSTMVFGIRKDKTRDTRSEDNSLNYPETLGSFNLVKRIGGGLLQDYVIYQR